MLVARYWAEARLQHRFSTRKQKNSQITLRRLGWSNESQQAAEDLAQQRVQEAMRQALKNPAAFDLETRRESARRSYNGADGLPIREEVIEENNYAAITRNSYGALCLNTPDVMFVDIDDHYHHFTFGDISSSVMKKIWIALVILIWLMLAYWFITCSDQPENASLVWAGFKILALLFSSLFLSVLLSAFIIGVLFELLYAIGNLAYRKRHPPLERIDTFSREHPQWVMNLYRTAAGYRLLVLHQKFDPADEALWKNLQKLGVDPLYSRMCRLQKCFRARLTPKPWRIGIHNRIAAGRLVWQAGYAQMSERIQWVTNYTQLSGSYASCSLIKQYGTGSMPLHLDPAIEAVLQLHDEHTRAHSELPLA